MKTLNKVSMVVAISVSVVLSACVSSDPQPDVSTSEALVASPSMLVGTFRFVYTDNRRAEIEEGLRKEAKSPDELARGMAAAEAEANASEIEFAKDGVFHSRVYEKEIFTSPYAATSATGSTLTLEMTSPKGEKKSTTVRFQDQDTIVIQDPKKGELTFRRASSRG